MKRNNFGLRAALQLVVVGFALTTLVPVSANAQVTVKHILVTMSQTLPSPRTVTYCDKLTSCDVQVWDLGNKGKTLAGGDTLVLTQTDLLPGVGGNFDTSDTVNSSGTSAADCNTGVVCSVTIKLDTGNGLTLVYDNSAANPDPLNNFNSDPGGAHKEYSPFQTNVAASGLNFTLELGYADNAHAACNVSAPFGCFPNPFDGINSPDKATIFIGKGVTLTGDGIHPLACSPNCYDGGAILITGVSVNTSGRMTGGGSVFETDGTRVTHGFELHCNLNDQPNSLEINWGGGNNFHLDKQLLTVVCIDAPDIAPPPPNAGFDTLIATGTGSFNGTPGYKISFTLTDAGEPGSKDTAKYVITDPSNNVVLDVGPALLTFGNQQAHKN